MNNVEPRGAVHWIDHYVVGTNDMGAWVDWAVNATGITRRPHHRAHDRRAEKKHQDHQLPVVGWRFVPHRSIPPARDLPAG